MQKKKYKKPLFYKKSKAAKEDQNHGRFLETDDYQRKKSHKHSPSKSNKILKYNRDYEHTDYDDGYGRNQYIYHYENGVGGFDDGMIEYTTEESSRYRRSPERVREYEMETQYSDESDSECFTCNSRRRQRSEYTSEYPSEYFREETQAPRHDMYRQSMTKKKRVIPSETEIARSPHRRKLKIRNGGRRIYHQEFEDQIDDGSTYERYYETTERENPYHRNQQEVYLARAPVGHEAFRYQEQKDIDEKSSTSGSETHSERDYEGHRKTIKVPKKRQNQSQYQIFVANVDENKALFQSQQGQNTREKLLSITEYDQTAAQKNMSIIKTQDENQSIVYLPVVVMDNSIKLPDSKVIPAESLLRNIGDMAEKPLETNNNMNIYIAAEDGHVNIFEEAQRNAAQEAMAPATTQMYTDPSNHSDHIKKNQSLVSKLTSKMKSKSKSDYPVQKSYINVAPTKSKLPEKKGSKTSVKSGASKTSKSSNKSGGSKISVSSSLVGLDKPKSPKGSAYYSGIHNKEIKEKKGRKNKYKNKSDESGSVLMSVIDLTGNQTKDSNTNSIVTQKSDFQKQSNIQPSASQILKITPTDKKSASRGNVTKQPTTDRPVPLVKQASLSRQHSASKDSKIITIKDVNKGIFEESKNVFEQSKADVQPTSPQSGTILQKKKSFGSSIFHRKGTKQKPDLSSKSAPKELDPYKFDLDHYNSPASSMTTVQRQKSQEDSQKAKKSASSKHIKSKKSIVDVTKKTDEFQFLNLMGLNSSVLVCIFQVVQYFLGLSSHGTLMEILRTFKQSD